MDALAKVMQALPSPADSWLMSDAVTKTLAAFDFRHCPACQRETATEQVCHYCGGLVEEDGMCPTCRKTVATVAVCTVCGAHREDEVAALRAEVQRLDTRGAMLANKLQAVQLLVQVLADNPKLTVRVACENMGVDYDTHILNRR